MDHALRLLAGAITWLPGALIARSTEEQWVMPDIYRTHPVHNVPSLNLRAGFDALAADLTDGMDMAGSALLAVIDGFVGIQWDVFIDGLKRAFVARGVSVEWISTDSCFLSADVIADRLKSDLTGDPYFGRIHRGHLEELWDSERVSALHARIQNRPGPTVLYGYGASLCGRDGKLVYVDVPKDRCQALAAAGAVLNVGSTTGSDFGTSYKRLYVVDWPMLNRIKRKALQHLDIFVDATASSAPIFVVGTALRRALSELAHQPFRLKPWFTPGPWGGRWMKDKLALPEGPVNYAWSFEMIAPENGILLGDERQSLEVSFDCLLWLQADAVMGPALVARYGTYFPLRFDYLDTVGGGNLSLQVHPSADFMREEYGEPIAEDETYYILDSRPGARVFLGLQDDANVEQFRADAERARDHGIPFDYDRYVASFPSEPHDLFLIPNGTVHSSGIDNLVLEISATPYLHTLKLYDFLRRDLNGNLRHMHLEEGFANLNTRSRATWARDHLMPQPTLLRQGTDWAEYSICAIDELFFAINRLEFVGTIADRTDSKVLALNLVAGETCEILTNNNTPVELRYAESIIIPACIGTFSIRNTGVVACKVVKVYVKG
jgi:mannose-6-phosphate isomerase class I